MKKRIFLFLFLTVNAFICFGKDYKIRIIRTNVFSSESKQYNEIELEYVIKNTINDVLYIYDIQKKNDNHYEEDYYEKNLCIKKIYVFRPSVNSWYGWGYNPNYPNFIRLNKGEKKKGVLKLRFELPKDIDPYKIQYQFNFIISDFDIKDYLTSLSIDGVNNKFRDIIVRFKL